MEEEFSLDLSRTYIYQGEEYIATGRSAKKEDTPNAAPRRERKSRRLRKSNGPDMMVEIQPAPRTSVRGAVVPSTSKELQWVKASDLYVVEDVIANDYWEPVEDESTDSSS